HLDVSKWQDDELLARARELVAELEGRELVALAYQDVLATVDRALDVTALIGSLRGRYLPAAIRAVARLFGWTLLAGRPREVSALLSGVETKTIRVNRALEALAEEVRASPALASVFASEPAEGALFGALERAPEAQAFLESFRAMLDEFGHRENVLLLASQPTWKDDPGIPLGAIRALASTTLRTGEVRTSGSADWERARARLL